MMQRLAGFLPDVFTHPHTARTVGLHLPRLSSALYVAGSLMHFRRSASAASKFFIRAPTSCCASSSRRRWS